MQVFSLIVFIAIDETIVLEDDNELGNSFRQAEDFDIQVFIISNKPKVIVRSRFELNQKYSVFEKNPFS